MVLVGCGGPQMGPGFAPAPELLEPTALAIADWNEHGAGFYLDPENGTPVTLMNGCVATTDFNPCALAAGFWGEGVIRVSRDEERSNLHLTMLHELCHVLRGPDPSHHDGPGVCGTQMWRGDGAITAEDLDWAGLGDVTSRSP